MRCKEYKDFIYFCSCCNKWGNSIDELFEQLNYDGSKFYPKHLGTYVISSCPIVIAAFKNQEVK
jgi:hypothetical protein